MDRSRQGRRPPPRRYRSGKYRRRRALALLALVVVAVAIAATALSGGDDGSGRDPVGPEAVTTETTPAAPQARRSSATEPVSIAAVGDIMMGSSDHGLPPDGGAGSFASVSGLLGADILLGNLEGPLTDATGGGKCGADSTSCFAFRTPPSYVAHLQAAGFDVMNVANNHAFDFGPQGLADTLDALAGAGIAQTGSVGTEAVIDRRGTTVAFVGFSPYPWSDPLLELDQAARRVEEAAAEADVVVVTMHGGAEGSDATHVPEGPESYLGEQRGDLRAFARTVIDAGADLVIGHGPHVLRGMELYKDRLVAYSLGNFVGYEAFSLSGPLSTSAVLRVRVAADGRFVDGTLKPVQLVGAGTPAPGGDAVAMVDRLSAEDFGARAVRLSPEGALRAP
jgi:poly-gamma-glutamate capsule biosynthesis protein CapA/YwtB (metallophosphatase superfamily)